MNQMIKIGMTAIALAVSANVLAQITLYEDDDYRGRTYSAQNEVRNLSGTGFENRASSVVIDGGQWVLCDGTDFSGRCITLQAGSYNSLSKMGMNDKIMSLRPLDQGNYQSQNSSQYQQPGQQQSLQQAENEQYNNMTQAQRDRYNNMTQAERDQYYYQSQGQSSQYNNQGNQYNNQGQYQQQSQQQNQQQPDYQYRRRPNEKIYTTTVISSHAIYNAGQQRCYMEHQPAPEPTSNYNTTGAVVGALLGGVLGHQVGGGTGRTLATVGGAVAGGALGANIGKHPNNQVAAADIQRCETVPNQNPEMWDVTYKFRGQEHHVQTSAPPGRTITVNRDGEPRF